MQLHITGEYNEYNDFQTNLKRIIILTSTTVISITALCGFDRSEMNAQARRDNNAQTQNRLNRLNIYKIRSTISIPYYIILFIIHRYHRLMSLS